MINFFDDERLSDITVTFSSTKVSAHKIVLAIHSPYFQEVLGGSPKVSRSMPHVYKQLSLHEGRFRGSTSVASTTLLRQQHF